MAASKGASKPQKPQPGWLNKQDMAASCGISLTGFDKWAIEPVAKIGRNTYYRVVDVLDNRKARWSATLAVKQAAEQVPELPSVIEAEREKMLLTREQRIGQELKNAQTRRELAPVKLLEWVIGKVGGADLRAPGVGATAGQEARPAPLRIGDRGYQTRNHQGPEHGLTYDAGSG